MVSMEQELKGNAYPGRGIVIGRSADGKYAVTAYFIMGRSENSRNRIFVTDGEGIRTQAFDPSKLSDPSLIIYAPVRVLGNKTIRSGAANWASSSPTGIRRIPSMTAWERARPSSSRYECGNLSRTALILHPASQV